MPRGFAGLLVVRDFATFHSDFGQTVGLCRFVEAVLGRPVVTLSTGICFRLLLRGITGADECCSSLISTSEGDSRPPKDAILETFGFR